VFASQRTMALFSTRTPYREMKDIVVAKSKALVTRRSSQALDVPEKT
jgi:hypothetical protein